MDSKTSEMAAWHARKQEGRKIKRKKKKIKRKKRATDENESNFKWIFIIMAAVGAQGVGPACFA